MHDAVRVCGRDGAGYLGGNREEALERQAALRDHVGEHPAFLALHRDDGLSAFRLDGVDVHDARMVECGKRAGLAIEPRPPIGIRGEVVGQELEGHVRESAGGRPQLIPLGV